LSNKKIIVHLSWHTQQKNYLDVLLDGGSLLELNLGDGSKGQQVLEAVGDGVWRGRERGVAHGQRHGGHVGYSLHELGAQIFRADVQDRGCEDGAGVIHL
jgi:hypothetical protein